MHMVFRKMATQISKELYFVFVFMLSLNGVLASKFYDFTAFDIKTYKSVPMKNYKGKIVLIVNVASECGFTHNHYTELVQLQQRYSQKFAVLGFPCNQFGQQEPGNEKEILDFANKHYSVNFQMFMKINTIGEHQNDLYKWLQETTGRQPNWNFCKYLLDENGNVVRFANPGTSPSAMENDIKKLVVGQKLKGSVLAYEDGDFGEEKDDDDDDDDDDNDDGSDEDERVYDDSFHGEL